MKIYLIDVQKWLRVNYGETRKLLCSGLTPTQWTVENVKRITNKTK